MSVPTTPQGLLDAAKCFNCVPPGLRNQVKTYVITDIVDEVINHGGHNPFVPTKVPTPTGLTFTYNAVTDQVDVAWDAVPIGPIPAIVSTNVWVSYTSAAGPYLPVDQTFVPAPGTTTSYTSPGLGNSAWVKIRFFNGSAYSPFTAVVQVTVLGGLNPVALDWANRVVINGGAMPSVASITAASDFWDAIEAAGLDVMMRGVNMIAPDSLIAAITPLWVGIGSDPWTNNNFVAGDLTVNGLKGNAANKFLNTGITALFGGDFFVGMTVYISQYSAPDSRLMGSVDVTSGDFNSAFGVSATAGSGIFQDLCYSLGNGRAVAAANSWQGYFSGNRVSTTNLKVFLANSVTPHFTAATDLINNGYFNNDGKIHMFQDSYVGGHFPTACRLSFGAVTEGLDPTQSSDFYNAIQQLRMDFGGGFV